MSYSATFITESLAHGGAELQLLQMLSKRPSDVEVNLILFSKGALDIEVESFGLRPHFVARSGKHWPNFVLNLSKEIRRQRPDIVHTWKDGTAGTAGRLAALLANSQRIVHSDRSLRGHLPTTRLQRSLRPFLDRRTTLFLPNSMPMLKALQGSGIPAERVHYLPNSLEIERFEQIPIRHRPLTLGFLAKLRPEKRPELLINALKVIPLNHRPRFVSIAGDGPLMSTLQHQIAQDSWLSANVELPGLITDVPNFLKTLDYLVLCSDYEGTPNVVLEAMACGIPIISTDVGGLGGILEECGEVIPRGNVHALAEAIMRMENSSQEYRASLGLRGRQYVEKNHQLQQNTALFWDIHRQLLEG